MPSREPKKKRPSVLKKRRKQHLLAPSAVTSTGPSSSTKYQPGPVTANFVLAYDPALGALGQSMAATMGGKCESDFQTLQGYFGVTPGGLPFHIYAVSNSDVQGAMHVGCASTAIYVGSLDGFPGSSNAYPLLLAAEVVEVFESALNNGWKCGYSNGEGLSRVLANALYPAVTVPSLVTAGQWLNITSPQSGYRFNWVDNTNFTDTDPLSNGCSVLFLNWMNTKLGYTWAQIAQAGGDTLGETYQSLSGSGDGWAKFTQAINTRFPPNVEASVSTDNPF